MAVEARSAMARVMMRSKGCKSAICRLPVIRRMKRMNA